MSRGAFLGGRPSPRLQTSVSSTGSSSRITSMTLGRKASRNFSNHVLALRTEEAEDRKMDDDGLCVFVLFGYVLEILYMLCCVVLLFFLWNGSCLVVLHVKWFILPEKNTASLSIFKDVLV